MDDAWIDALPDSLVKATVSMAPAGLPYRGFPLDAAVEVAISMRTSQFACLGGDEWSEIEGSLRPVHENWSTEPMHDESHSDFVVRSWQAASEHLAAVPSSSSGTVIVFVVDD